MKTISSTIAFVMCFVFTHAQVIEKKYFEDALTIILSFETNSMKVEDGYDKVTGNFDGNGISLGLLQWNMGTGSLQRLVKKVGVDVVSQTMPKYGSAFWTACLAKREEGLRIVNSWQTNNIVNDEQRKELQAFLKSGNVQEIQYQKAMYIGRIAMDTAKRWAKDIRNSDTPTFKEFVYFLDLYTFNDGLKKLWIRDVKIFKEQYTNPQREILTWLNTREKPLYSLKDAKANYQEWSTTVLDDRELNLFILGYLRALISNGDSGKFKADVLNRRGTISIGTGTVHQSHYDFRALYEKYR